MDFEKLALFKTTHSRLGKRCMKSNQIDFAKILKNRRYKDKTIKSYISWIDELNQFYPDKDINGYKHNEIKKFLNHLSENCRLSSSTVSQAFFAIRLFFQAKGRDNLDLSDLAPKRGPRPIPKVPSQKEVLDILDNTNNIICRTGLSVLYSTGIELGELVTIRVRDVDLVGGTIAINLQRNRQKRKAIIADNIRPSIELLIKGKRPGDFLFSKEGDKSYSTTVFQRAFKTAKHKSGINTNYSVRSLRYAYIKHMEYFGVPLVKITRELGLSENATLGFYSKIGYPGIPVTFSPLDRIILPDEEEQSGIKEPYVSEARITKLSRIDLPSFDLNRLIELLRELNQAHLSKSLMSISMIMRAILDHVPPIFGFNTFNEVSSNYSGGRSFKSSMKHLNLSLRNIADTYLHVPIRKKESIPVFNQVDFRADLDVLLGEIIRLLL